MKLKKKVAGDMGMTLVEVLITLMIIGIMSGIAYVGLAGARKSSAQNACRTAYQAVSLAVANYQADNQSLPPSLAALSLQTSTNPDYLNPGLLATTSTNYGLTLGTSQVTSYSSSGTTRTIYFASTNSSTLMAALLTSGDPISIAGVDSTNFDGTWTATSTASTSGSGYKVTYTGASSYTLSTTTAPTSGAIINAVTTATTPFEVYVLNPSGTLIAATNNLSTAPAACSLVG